MRGSKAVSDDFGPHDLTTAPQSTESRQSERGDKAASDDFGPYGLTTVPRALTTNPVSGVSLLTTSPAIHVPPGLNLLDVMHIRLGHMPEAKIKHVRHNLYAGCPITYDQIKDLKLRTCFTCQMGRMRASNRNKALHQDYKPLECLAVDYKGSWGQGEVRGDVVSYESSVLLNLDVRILELE
jgi:hypothetical protein